MGPSSSLNGYQCGDGFVDNSRPRTVYESDVKATFYEIIDYCLEG